MRKFLIIVRAGETSLHREWMPLNNDRNWDLIVSSYGCVGKQNKLPGVLSFHQDGPKFPTLKKLLLGQLAALLPRYKYIWFPDDDLATDSASINRFFDISSQFNLGLSQPSLASTSFVSHPITISNPHYMVRFTNFVETMAVCFRHDVLVKCLDSLDDNISSWGLDYVWANMARGLEARVGIVDAVQVKHTRAFGGPNYNHLTSSTQITQKEAMAWEELKRTLARYKLIREPLLCKSAVDIHGNELSGDRFENEREKWFSAPW